MKRFAFLLCLLAAPALCGCVSLVYYDGTYRGRVIDAQTLEPIEGAVVLGVWFKVYHTAGGPIYDYYNARETVTDAQGEFTIVGMRPRVLTHLEKMDVVIFKSGYEHVGLTPWDSLKTAINYQNRVQWENGKAIIPLDKWDIEQRRKRLDQSVTGVPNEKQQLLIGEIQKEKKQIR